MHNTWINSPAEVCSFRMPSCFSRSLSTVGKTAGLFGFWDDSKEQEFLLPNGSFIHTNSSYRTLHNEFGQKCKYCRTGIQVKQKLYVYHMQVSVTFEILQKLTLRRFIYNHCASYHLLVWQYISGIWFAWGHIRSNLRTFHISINC
jgi:hypothetical protein